MYERLKREQPDFTSHVVLVQGDTGASDLGLSVNDRDTLIENIHIVFHVAATVRFDESLRQVVNINVRGTKLIVLLAKEMRNLKVKILLATLFYNIGIYLNNESDTMTGTYTRFDGILTLYIKKHRRKILRVSHGS